MEAWNGKKAVGAGGKLQVARRPHRVVFRFPEPVTEMHLSFDEALAFAQVVAEKARDGRIIMPGDLGVVPASRR